MRHFCISLFVLTGLAAAGCSDSSGNAEGVRWNQQQSSGQVAAAGQAPSATAMLLRRGPAPIAYMVATGGRLYVRDVETGKLLVETQLKARTTVSVDSAKGIYAGDRKLMAGPLPTGRQFELWLDATRKN